MQYARLSLKVVLLGLCTGCQLNPVDVMMLVPPITVHCQMPDGFQASGEEIVVCRHLNEAAVEQMKATAHPNRVTVPADKIDSNGVFEVTLPSLLFSGVTTRMPLTPLRISYGEIILIGAGDEVICVDLGRRPLRAMRYNPTAQQFITSKGLKCSLHGKDPRVLEIRNRNRST